MGKEKHQKISVKLSWYLRHNKDIEAFKKDENWNGSVPVEWILKELEINMTILDEIVETDKKGRYSFNSDKTTIKANQGHSVNVNLGLIPSEPPKILYHGTNQNVKDIILDTGLKPMNRQFVHLSEDIETASVVGKRRVGDLVILKIDSESMYKDNIEFVKSQNGVWLVDIVNPKYLSIVI